MAVWLRIVIAACLLGSPAQAAVYGTDLRGAAVSSLGGAIAVLFFVATDCPVSNRYVPEIKRLEAEFTGKGVTVWRVYPNAGETVDGVRRHETEYGFQGGRVLLRPSADLLERSEARITPEAAVMDPQLRRLYAGRIDDRYLSIGRERPQATRHDLEAAVDAALHGAVAPVAGGPPVGCGIVTERVLAGAPKQ